MLARLAILLGNIINDKSRAGSNPSKSLVSEVLMVSHSCGCGFVSNPRAGVYLGEKTFEVFLCFVATVRVGVYYIGFFVFFVLRYWVTSFFTYDEPSFWERSRFKPRTFIYLPLSPKKVQSANV